MRENSIGLREYWVNRDDCVVDDSKVLDQAVGSGRFSDQENGSAAQRIDRDKKLLVEEVSNDGL